jgi:uncharacterized membrane protein YkvA (DUF1232 family)
VDALWIALIAVGAVLLLLALVAAYAGWRVYRSDQRALARRIGKLRWRDKLALGFALFGDPRVPAWARIVAVALVLYIATPIDIVPDFIPVLGQLDDLLILMIGGGLLLRSIPRAVLEEHIGRLESERAEKAGGARPR